MVRFRMDCSDFREDEPARSADEACRPDDALLFGKTPPLDGAAVPDLPNPFGGAPVLFLAETGSTMDDAAAFASGGAGHGSVVWAAHQHGGRGRVAGRVWTGARGESLTFTIALLADSVPFPAVRLPLLAGLAVARFLELEHGLQIAIKWPNDVLSGNGKLCGILCETRGRYLLAGIGLNCNQTTFPPELAGRAASIRQLSDREVSLRETLEKLLQHLHTAAYEDGPDGGTWKDAVERRLYRRGETVRLMTGLPDSPVGITARIEGLSDDGALLVTRTGERAPSAYYAGELAFA